MTDFLTILFGADAVVGPSVIETVAAERAEMRAEFDARMAAEAAEIARTRCPKCGGSGRIAAFTHFKGGSCFHCCGTGRLS